MGSAIKSIWDGNGADCFGELRKDGEDNVRYCLGLDDGIGWNRGGEVAVLGLGWRLLTGLGDCV